jgi:predicted nuclease of predicted toxin-antitoxin system
VSARFKVDEDLPRQVADLLLVCGHDAAPWWGKAGRECRTKSYGSKVQSEGRWLMTADKGFADLRQYPPGRAATVSEVKR